MPAECNLYRDTCRTGCYLMKERDIQHGKSNPLLKESAKNLALWDVKAESLLPLCAQGAEVSKTIQNNPSPAKTVPIFRASPL